MLVLVLVASCAAPQAFMFEGKAFGVVDGHGGAVRTVEGVDFWAFGAPDRRYRVVGVVMGTRSQPAVAAVARQHHAHVVMLGSDADLSGLIEGRELAPTAPRAARFVLVTYERMKKQKAEE